MLWAVAALAMTQLPIKTTDVYPETAEQKNARMEWFREARFGMFIHWGLYSIPAGEWMGSKGHGEWIRETAQIPLEAYDRLVPHFNPYKFDAKEWVQIAKDAGMKYIVITTKHHDGFALYDSAVSDFDITATPFKRDVMAELADECRKEGIILCFYHSIMDWHHPDYLPRRAWESEMRPVGDAQMDRYVQYLHKQVTEILTKYGPIGIVWFDGEWESTWNHQYGQALYNLCRTLQPRTIVNNRVDIGRGGMGGMSDAGFAGDYGTPEQEIPAKGIPGVDWETCMTMNGHWGFNRHDKSFKSTKELLQNLVDIASKGGNYLLNVGPDSLGEIPGESVDRLKEIGAWMRANGDAIYGTTASLFNSLPWGRSTTKRNGDRTTIYLHVFDWPSGDLVVPGVGTDPKHAKLLGEGSVKASRSGPNLLIDLRGKKPDASVSVIAIEFDGDPVIYETPTFEETPEIFVKPPRIKVNANPGLEVRYQIDNGAMTPGGEIQLPNSAAVIVAIQGYHNGVAVTDKATREFKRVTPKPKQGIPQKVENGLNCTTFSGSWDTIPNFSLLTPSETFVMSQIGITPQLERENVGALVNGYIHIPESDVYIFELSSDDGSKLYVDGEVVVDNDGLHSMLAKTGAVALEQGHHSIIIEWFNKTGASALGLRYKTPGGEFRPVPADWFSHR